MYLIKKKTTIIHQQIVIMYRIIKKLKSKLENLIFDQFFQILDYTRRPFVRQSSRDSLLSKA